MANDVTELLDVLYERKISLEEVTARFRGRTWPFDRAVDTGNSGSWEDVEDANQAGRLTDDQYPTLLEAIVAAQAQAAGQ
jgi:hypothetical protein